jgi:tetratricopeptide (TPR) repeat protein
MLMCLDSIQGLYDECIVAVDDRPESDEVFEAIQIYPNLVAYRQKWPGRFDYARQEVLNRVSTNATYVGHCDSDEVLLQPSPRAIREILFEEQIRAVNVGILYKDYVGPHEPGGIYLRTKIWKTDHVRKYVGKIHEYPTVQGENIIPTPRRDIIFEHQKVDHKAYRSEFIIKSMIEDIENGHTRWLPYLGEEYRADGKYDQALGAFRRYLRLDIKDVEHSQHLKKCLEEMIRTLDSVYNGDQREKWRAFCNELAAVNEQAPFLQSNPIFWEYYALSRWYLDGKDAARGFHDHAKSLDPEQKESFIWNNDQFY